MLGTYMVTGWSARFGSWVTEHIEAKTMEAAKKRFVLLYPTLKTIKVYSLRSK